MNLEERNYKGEFMDKELFEKLLKGYQDDLAQLDEIKEENSHLKKIETEKNIDNEE